MLLRWLLKHIHPIAYNAATGCGYAIVNIHGHWVCTCITCRMAPEAISHALQWLNSVDSGTKIIVKPEDALCRIVIIHIDSIVLC